MKNTHPFIFVKILRKKVVLIFKYILMNDEFRSLRCKDLKLRYLISIVQELIS